ncbi:MAG: UDP-N-acetylmuramoylalanine--D-glutamate ligase [Candidatus Saganbacteria bacterium]|uniref:UDP-N-acetylmuramoylalanine--D-glutamate ligase n=1 Tax=Candidatus Saganbacteria bacterium TaxID=2575572 RepID=A0A833L144_UNCSA|nr:MAG: UDP-N-acetylmuramoylalanine--D-glutamate ligase [Candidatus Saganbacteria bacterium]
MIKDKKDKKITVLGFGKSGASSARRLAQLNNKVIVSESKGNESFDPELISDLQGMGVLFEFGGHSLSSISDSDLIIISPGIHLDIPIVVDAKKRNIPVISEIELAYRFLSKPIIAVTGTNGKTTTTTLIGEFLKAAGKNIAIAGNIGRPLVEVDDKNLDFIVVELSSYQLETILTFRPWIAAILNLTEDHLERHKSMDEYALCKSRIFMNQRKTDFIIYNADDPRVVNLLPKAEAKLIPFSKRNAFIKKDEMLIPGDHNLENALAAAQIALIAGVKIKVIKEVLSTFKGVEHRIELFTEKKGVKYYNDSKATNPDSTVVALKSLDEGKRNVILIAGGRDKGGDLTNLAKMIKASVKKAILIGEAAERFGKALKEHNFQDIIFASSFEEAVNISYSLAQNNEKVVLSPACASFDMFKNFEERGIQFKKLVNSLPQ